MSVLWRIRAAVLVVAGLLALHHARYALVSPTHEHGQDHRYAAAHEYLAWLAPLVGAVLFVLIAHFAGSLRSPSGRSPVLPRRGALWAMASATLLAVFVGQETVESWLTHGYRPELLESFSAGGWVALPLAALIGAFIALALRGARRVVEWAIARATRHAPRPSSAPQSPSARPLLAPRACVLARFLAGRAPPALS